MGKLIEPVRYLNPEEMQRIHGAALRILDETGMKVDSQEALAYLEQAGCRVNYDRRHVSFPPEVVQAAVDRMRQAYADPNRIPRRMAVRYSQIYFTTLPHLYVLVGAVSTADLELSLNPALISCSPGDDGSP